MKDFLINQIAAYALSLLTPDLVKDPLSVVHHQGDHIAIAVIDFKTHQYQSIHIINKKIIQKPLSPIFFDLASLTKPLTLASTYLSQPEVFKNEEMLLLNHRGSLPAGFKVEANSDAWKQYVSNLPVKESKHVTYSDTSAVRLMLNLEKKQIDIPLISHEWLDDEVIFWKDLPRDAVCPSTGKRNRVAIRCDVHDPTAYKINRFVTNAGLFGTVDGVAKSLLNLNSGYLQLNQLMRTHLPKAKNRFLMGWEVNKMLENHPGGTNYIDDVFGHRGYTGTSIWINTKLNRGLVLLTNTSSLENGKNANTLLNSKNYFRQKLSNFLWKLSETNIR